MIQKITVLSCSCIPLLSVPVLSSKDQLALSRLSVKGDFILLSVLKVLLLNLEILCSFLPEVFPFLLVAQ